MRDLVGGFAVEQLPNGFGRMLRKWGPSARFRAPAPLLRTTEVRNVSAPMGNAGYLRRGPDPRSGKLHAVRQVLNEGPDLEANWDCIGPCYAIDSWWFLARVWGCIGSSPVRLACRGAPGVSLGPTMSFALRGVHSSSGTSWDLDARFADVRRL